MGQSPFSGAEHMGMEAKMKHAILFASALSIAFGFPAMGNLHAQQAKDQKETLTLEEIERGKRFEDATRAADELLAKMKVVTETKRQNCIAAFGHKVFCDCLANETPVGISFEGYIKVVTTEKEDLRYSQLPDEDKKIVDKTRLVRNKCVKKALSK